MISGLRRLNVSSIHGNSSYKRIHTSQKSNSSLLEADSSKPLNKAYHTSGLLLAVLTPAAFIISPSVVNMPIDIALGVLFPFHSHVAMNYIVSDYVPKASRPLARGVILATSLIAAAGLLRLNLEGPGLTESIKSLWRKPKSTDK